MITRREQVQELQKKYKLSQMRELEYDRDQILFYLQKDLNEKILSYDLGVSQTGRNIFAEGIRLVESNISALITDRDDEIYLDNLEEEYDRTVDIDSEVNILFERYGHLNRILEGVRQKPYVALEDETGGVISQYIKNRILTRDQNFILGIFGPPGAGKSAAGERIGMNTSGLGELFNLDDVVYGRDLYLNALVNRREAGKLKGSTQIIDEGGCDLDAMTWWDQEVQGSIKVLRTQRFQNTLTIIISPEYKDIVNRARGLFHAVLIPWYEMGGQRMELTDNDNIDQGRGISTWRFLTLDTDPITGDLYKKRLKVAGGYVKKVELQRPPKRFEDSYKRKSMKEKNKILDREHERQSRTKLREGLATDRQDIVHQILKAHTKYRGNRGGISRTEIMRRHTGVGSQMALLIQGDVEEALALRQKNKNKAEKEKKRQEKEQPPQEETKDATTD